MPPLIMKAVSSIRSTFPLGRGTACRAPTTFVAVSMAFSRPDLLARFDDNYYIASGQGTISMEYEAHYWRSYA
jgi:hypothetical protein